MQLLIIEDEAKTAAYLAKGLRDQDFTVDVAHDGTDGPHPARKGTHDLIILDVMLPGTSGWHIVRELRAAGRHTPVLLLSARDAVEDRVKGLDLGADGYLAKPFAFTWTGMTILSSSRQPAVRIQSLFWPERPMMAMCILNDSWPRYNPRQLRSLGRIRTGTD